MISKLVSSFSLLWDSKSYISPSHSDSLHRQHRSVDQCMRCLFSHFREPYNYFTWFGSSSFRFWRRVTPWYMSPFTFVWEGVSVYSCRNWNLVQPPRSVYSNYELATLNARQCIRDHRENSDELSFSLQALSKSVERNHSSGVNLACCPRNLHISESSLEIDQHINQDWYRARLSTGSTPGP